jgi:hypothetical protein
MYSEVVNGVTPWGRACAAMSYCKWQRRAGKMDFPDVTYRDGEWVVENWRYRSGQANGMPT